MLDIAPSLPITEALQLLHDRDIITTAEHKTLSSGMLTAVRTYGDLVEVVRTGDIRNIPGIGDKFHHKLCNALKPFGDNWVIVGTTHPELMRLPQGVMPIIPTKN